MHNSQRLTYWVISLSLHFLIRSTTGLIRTRKTGILLKLCILQSPYVFFNNSHRKNNPMGLKILKFSDIPIQRYFNWILYTHNTLERKSVKRDLQISTDHWIYYAIVCQSGGKKNLTNTNKRGAWNLIHKNVPLHVLQWGRRNLKRSWKDMW